MGPADGQIASAGHAQFNELNVQTSSRWYKNPVKAGPVALTWTFTAKHKTAQFRYFITREDWNPNQPLTRMSFDLNPFCSAPYGGQIVPETLTHNCTLPARTGYQVILAVWDVSDTGNAFYNVIDVDFGSGATSPGGDNTVPAAQWTSIGQISPTLNLKAGDKVTLRVFDSNGERSDLAQTLLINSDSEGNSKTWSYNLAVKVNNSSNGLIRAGQINGDKIEPVYDTNNVYAAANSQIVRTEVQIEQKQQVASTLSIEGVASSISITPGQTLPLSVGVNVGGQPMDIEATVFSHDGNQQAYSSKKGVSGLQTLNLQLTNVQTGQYNLVVVGKNAQGDIIQKTQTFVTTSSADNRDNNPAYSAVFPEGIASYAAGTRVLQPADGKVYQCKPWPYSGYCKQWSSNARGFEPGVGDSWEMAWIKVE
ncbi:N-acetylglucosamine-binding protein GbpA [Buttiauxella warmboldiae]|uniref:N-acetylglucosamine-binding protein GbpA n=1 Tax=Buttiauxella warmboldiae TaxID=82993 RepID=A0A3N5EEP1_9ENTR|nr:N-acetylglucosamine-binding protein GbpA [Buttiauxella warmboldiae]RPH29622.1 N-acetylglucosamine-binding protein GbpA [Buttiauxella warmboldiae]